MSIFSHRIDPPKIGYDRNVIAEVRHVTKSYAGSVALSDVSLRINLGDFTIFTGHSGSGKSTLLSMLEGVTTPDTGSIVLFGQDLQMLREKQIERLKRNHIGIGFQDPLLDRSHTVANVMRQTAGANGKRVDYDRIKYLAARFTMLGKLMSEAGGLSGGEQMRASMMRALATSPDLILLDEPTGAVDTKGKIAAMETMRQVMQEEESTVVMITHDPDVARPFADRELVLESGRLVADINLRRV